MLPNGTNTYAGIIVALATVVLPLFGLTPTPAFSADFPALLAAVVEIAALAYAAYGRTKAIAPGWFAKNTK